MIKKSKRRPILMGKAERVESDVEPPCSTPLTRSILERSSLRPVPLLSITPKCHPESGMKIWYDRSDGCAVLSCSECNAGVARLLLAAGLLS